MQLNSAPVVLLFAWPRHTTPHHTQVKLLDCPGIVFDDSDAGATLLRNCVDAEAMTDPTPAIAAVLKRCAPEQLMQVGMDEPGWGGVYSCHA